MNIAPLAHDRPGSEETDPGHDLGRDACRVYPRAKFRQETEPGEHARTEGDQAHRFDPRLMASKLPLDSKDQTENECDQKAETEVGVAPGKRQLLRLRRARRPGCH